MNKVGNISVKKTLYDDSFLNSRLELKISGNDIDHIIVNTLRRICLTNIPVYIYDKFVYFYPSIEDNTYIIPRSNPKTKTMGKIAKNFNDIVIFRHEQYYVYVEWIENKQTYRKLVPIKLFTAINNISQTFKIRSICQRLNVSNEDFKNNII